MAALSHPRAWGAHTGGLYGSFAGKIATLALSGAGYEIGDGNSPDTMAAEASVSFNIAVYPSSQWPLTAPTLTVSADTSDANGNLSDIVSALLTTGADYRLVFERVTDGAVWITEMTAV